LYTLTISHIQTLNSLFCLLLQLPPPTSTLIPYTTLFRSQNFSCKIKSADHPAFHRLGSDLLQIDSAACDESFFNGLGAVGFKSETFQKFNNLLLIFIFKMMAGRIAVDVIKLNQKFCETILQDRKS